MAGRCLVKVTALAMALSKDDYIGELKLVF